ncbi:Putative HTH-type transcriptional regulator y4qH [Gluconacetobacter sp. SXCC-1]|nr:LuxR family transcriptional regulator [Komagataeibacter xylinus]EGG76940.1 Putative HTH-type transcriptional regulator y4qH [Gluconacetobacter sp. SXCC-1]
MPELPAMMARLYTDIFDLAADIRGAPDHQALAEAFGALVSRLGPHAYSMGTIHKTDPLQRHLIATTYPDHWMAHYVARNYHHIDPVIDPLRHGLHPYDWKDIHIENRRQDTMLREFGEMGFRSGHAVPLALAPGTLLLVSIASYDPHIDTRQQMAIQLAASQFHYRYHQLGRKHAGITGTGLTRRERECLTWVAQGKDTADIGHILALSDNTIKFHLKNALRKLGCHNRVQAAVKATCLGLIHP